MESHLNNCNSSFCKPRPQKLLTIFSVWKGSQVPYHALGRVPCIPIWFLLSAAACIYLPTGTYIPTVPPWARLTLMGLGYRSHESDKRAHPVNQLRHFCAFESSQHGGNATRPTRSPLERQQLRGAGPYLDGITRGLGYQDSRDPTPP